MALTQRENTYLIILLCVCILFGGMLLLVVPQYKIFTQQFQKLGNVKSQSESLNLQKTVLIQDINRYKYQINDSRKTVGFTFPDEKPEQRIKGFLRELLTLSANTGNELISILPSQTNQQVSIKTTVEETRKPTAEEAAATIANGTATSTSKEEIEKTPQHFVTVKEKSLPLYTTTMDMQLRGSYQSILVFIKALAKHNTLLKVESFQLSYEAIDANNTTRRSRTEEALAFNATKPIRLVLKIKLYLLEAGFKS